MPDAGTPNGPVESARPNELSNPKSGFSRRQYTALGLAVLLTAVGVSYLIPTLRARKHCRNAERALDRRDFREAKAQVNECLAIRPNSSDYNILSIQITRRSGDENGAEELVRAFVRKHTRSVALDREIYLLRVQQGGANVDTILTEALARGEGADVLALEAALVGGTKMLFSAALQQETIPGGLAVPLLLKFLRAVDLWLRLRTGRPDQAQGLTWRGQAKMYSNDLVGAVSDFREALTIDPENREARVQFALTTSHEAPAEAANHFRLLLERDPDDRWLKYHLATLCRRTGRPDEARHLLDEVLAAQPDNVEALLESGGLALDLGQFEEAERRLSHAQKLAPDHPGTNIALASCLRATGRTDEAKVYQGRYLRLVQKREPLPPGSVPPR